MSKVVVILDDPPDSQRLDIAMLRSIGEIVGSVILPTTEVVANAAKFAYAD